MHPDKPDLKTVQMLNDLADVHAALAAAGLEPGAIARISEALARSRMGPPRPARGVPSDSFDWHGGRWGPPEDDAG